MSRIPDDKIGEMLQQGLRQVPVPAPSADFDARVRRELRRNQIPRWQLLWTAAWQIAAPAACSLAITLAVLMITGMPGQKNPAEKGSQRPADIAFTSRPSRLQEVERDLERARSPHTVRCRVRQSARR